MSDNAKHICHYPMSERCEKHELVGCITSLHESIDKMLNTDTNDPATLIEAIATLAVETGFLERHPPASRSTDNE